MELFGTTRSRCGRSHALIAPDSFVTSELPGWEQSQGVILIAPRMGARFAQYFATMDAGGTAGQPPPDVERLVYVLEGQLAITISGSSERLLGPGGFVYCAPNADVELRANSPSRLNVFEKQYANRRGVRPPDSLCGDIRDVQGEPFMGDPDAVLKTLLPRDARFDLAVNVFTFQPGTTLPLVEVHVMEHGLLMLEGQGIYRLGDDWYPVKKGDVIWMAPFCPQWFVAMGKGPASYLYYKDVNRDPMEEQA
jgi:(S)-ureidoglycine aminohydrolase